MSTEEENSLLISRAERKLLYRKLQDELKEMQFEVPNAHSTTKIQNVFNELDSLDNSYTENIQKMNSDEILLDFTTVSLAGNVVIKCLDNMNVLKTTYDPTDFAAQITRSTSETGSSMLSNLLTLMPDARRIIRDIPKLVSINGSYNADATIVRKHTKHTKEVAPKVKLNQITNLEQEDENVNETVNLLHKKLLEKFSLNNNTPINYYKYILDRTCYGSTVQNIFYSSFLVQSGKACIEFNENSVTIKPIKKKELQELQERGNINSQFMFSITMEEWQQMCLNN